jgi:hypothetical protein
MGDVGAGAGTRRLCNIIVKTSANARMKHRAADQNAFHPDHVAIHILADARFSIRATVIANATKPAMRICRKGKLT